MARLYSGKKGRSGSTKPVRKVPPSWLKYKPAEVEKLVLKLAKEEKSSAEIGIILRDTYGIPNVKSITSKLRYYPAYGEGYLGSEDSGLFVVGC